MNLFSHLIQTADDRTLLTDPVSGQTMSYADMDRRSGQLAAALLHHGATPGDRIVIQIEKSPDALAVVLACLRSGLVFVPLNTAYTAEEVRFFLDDTGATIFLSTEARADELAGLTIESLNTSVEPVTTVADLEADTMAAMLYTSGTTGRSKGAMLTHGSLLANAEALHDVWLMEADDVVLHNLPVFHVHGLFVAIFPTMLAGGSLIFCPRFDVGLVVEQLPNATVVMGVPTHYTRLLADERFDRSATESLRLITSGSAPMTEAVHQAFTERTGRHIVERYGMTETGILTSNPAMEGQVAGSVGFALPGHEIRISDEGQVEVLLPVPFAGYWQLPDKTAEAVTDDGWFRTGDVGSLDEDGRVWLDGRASDMIISGGYNVYPKEIELVLDEVEGVDEAAVVGVPHPDFGEAVIAVIATSLNEATDDLEERLREACQRPLARFKHPKRYLFVSELPRNAMAKVQKKALRTEHADLFSAGQPNR